jgi:uncharacterized protein (TIGR04222 family)
MDYSDPYLLAYLRGGEKETIRVAALSLADRGLLQSTPDRVSAPDKNAMGLVRRPLESAILERLQVVGDVRSVLNSPFIKAACKEYKDKLQQLRLIPDDKAYAARLNRLLIALTLLLGVAAIKILVALSRGHHNIMFLILLAAFASYTAVKIYNPFRTALGDIVFADIKTLFSSLKTRSSMIRLGGATGEAALLMAVFGVGALPMGNFPIIHQFEDKPKSTSSGCGGSGCSSSSSCSGGSCGGGGGCGGCGGGS